MKPTAVECEKKNWYSKDGTLVSGHIFTARECILDEQYKRYYFVDECRNCGTMTAGSTTWTVGFLSVSNYSAIDTVVQDTRQTTQPYLPITIVQSLITQPVSGTVSANITPISATPYNLVTTASTNGANIKATNANLFEVSVSNPTATPVYVKFYNKATAPTVGTDVPIITIVAPANATTPLNFGILGKRFSSGLGIAVTGGIASTDTSNAVAGVIVNGTYL